MFLLFEWDNERNNPGRAGPYGSYSCKGVFPSLEEAKNAHSNHYSNAHIAVIVLSKGKGCLRVVSNYKCVDGWDKWEWVEE